MNELLRGTLQRGHRIIFTLTWAVYDFAVHLVQGGVVAGIVIGVGWCIGMAIYGIGYVMNPLLVTDWTDFGTLWIGWGVMVGSVGAMMIHRGLSHLRIWWRKSLKEGIE